MPKIGVISDIHFKDSLGYADHFEDRREGEKKLVLDKVREAFADCDAVVLNGDQLNSKDNSSVVIKEFVEFLESLGNKPVIILGGNHEKKGSGKSALDFLKAIEGKPNWQVFIDEIGYARIGGKNVTFLPYFHKSELGVTKNSEGTKKIMEMLASPTVVGDPTDILFVHHAISSTYTETGVDTASFDEVILDKAELEKRFKLVVGGHIHKHQHIGQTVVVGNTFTNEMGDTEKYVITIDTDTLEVTPVKLPCRPIFKVENPKTGDAEKFALKYGEDSIVRVELTKRVDDEVRAAIKKEFNDTFSAFMLLEKYPRTRKKLHFDEGVAEFSVETLLPVYAKENDIDEKKLAKAWEIINK